jgi:hypothetical protein
MLPTVRLIRLEENHKHGTFGTIIINSRVFSVCLEPADLENRRNVSSIPAQQYLCRRYSSEKYPDTFQIMNVPDRSKVLIHSGNTIHHTEGCILLAQHVGKLNAGGAIARGVLNSGKTFKAFMALMNGFDEFHLTVIECY